MARRARIAALSLLAVMGLAAFALTLAPALWNLPVAALVAALPAAAWERRLGERRLPAWALPGLLAASLALGAALVLAWGGAGVTQSWMAVPLVTGDDTIGYLTLDRRSAVDFS